MTEAGIRQSGIAFRARQNGKATIIDADQIEVALPNGVTFLISAPERPQGGITLHIPANGPDDPQFGVFSIEPGAANTIFVRATLYDRDTDDGLRPEDLNASNDD
ncbi:hypothetical protein G6N74_08525 [Mesorhizobium sp. CGMCC 1.15528]|uniref:Uncharacterized protein n=1 Tax=Mesorhizobium zhangyense TaxID=1776730 RepID=A0A7C9VAR7_9HYPH|nr:hypothetical protein [Mesorhizobium zhangyense]NGN41107.1 hypothetical protein [Mesorhizobium zhangyense]